MEIAKGIKIECPHGAPKLENLRGLVGSFSVVAPIYGVGPKAGELFFEKVIKPLRATEGINGVSSGVDTFDARFGCWDLGQVGTKLTPRPLQEWASKRRALP
jgi:hypothetical protein